MNLVLIGPPGSGKGTQATGLEAAFDIDHIATGNLFRENQARRTRFGELSKRYMDQGNLVPDEVTLAMLQDHLAEREPGRGFVLDGFPRTLEQAKQLNGLLDQLGLQLHRVLYIAVPDQTIISRLAGRLVCARCQTPFHKDLQPFTTCPTDQCEGEYLVQRDDDTAETVRARLKTYHERTKPVISWYAGLGLLHRIDGEAAPEIVGESVIAAVRQLREPDDVV